MMTGERVGVGHDPQLHFIVRVVPNRFLHCRRDSLVVGVVPGLVDLRHGSHVLIHRDSDLIRELLS